MCGICGMCYVQAEGVDSVTLHRMADALVHRGPDDEGYYIDAHVGLANRRLSIIDLKGGKQPITNEDGTIHVVSNGEIYNFKELRRMLEAQGHRFKTESDTETIVHSYEQFGDDCVHHLNGMFAFAVWDAKVRRLFVARDRLGKKPLYYANLGADLVFASEIASLLMHKHIPRDLRLEAVPLYLRLGYSPAPMTMFRDIHKLPAGCSLVWDHSRTIVKRYWDLTYLPKRKVREREVIEEIWDLLTDAVKCRLISDVPVGAFLSGGVDSSTVVAIMSRVSGLPIRTFTVAFKGGASHAYDESPYARLVAERYGTRHTEIEVEESVADLFPKLVRHYGEPFADYSSVPSYYVSLEARRHITVVLSGDGGDEVFEGYPWYAENLASSRVRSALLTLGNAQRVAFSRLCSLDLWDALRQIKHGLWRAMGVAGGPVDLCERWAERHAYWNRDTLRELLAGVDSPGVLACGTGILPDLAPGSHGLRDLDLVSYLDFKGFLSCDLLVKMDIASMANSLEVRSPFLDYRLVEYTASLPSGMKVKGGQPKGLLKELVKDILPPSIINRPKMGFTPPVQAWFRGDMLPIAKDLLTEERLRSRGLFNPLMVRKLLKAHEEGTKDFGHLLWTLVFFEQWCDTFLGGSTGTNIIPSSASGRASTPASRG